MLENRFYKSIAFLIVFAVLGMSTPALAEPCLKITLTGTQGGPPVFRGQAGAGTLVQYGDSEAGCNELALQFDAGRGTTQSLSKINVPVARLSAIFLTHMHSDHTEGMTELMQLRWHFASKGPKLDLVVSEDIKSPAGHILSGRSFAKSIGDTLIASGEMAQRLVENPDRLAEGPAGLINIVAFDKVDEPELVWSSGDVSVLAINSRHIPGHASYRVDTPAGSVVIGGDAGNTKPAPPRDMSTSAEVEMLASGVDVIVHSTIHPVMGPDKDSGFPAPVYYRQSTATDLGAMAKRVEASHLMLTHLIPPLDAVRQGPYPIPGGALTAEDYETAVVDGGYSGNTIVGTDLVSLTLPAD